MYQRNQYICGCWIFRVVLVARWRKLFVMPDDTHMIGAELKGHAVGDSGSLGLSAAQLVG